MRFGRRQALAAMIATSAQAEGRFPDKPIRLIVPYTAGGSTDAYLRALAEAASRQFGVAVVAENRSGGGGIMGAQALAGGARPDGYTVAQMPASVFRHPWVAPRPAFDPLTDFTWIIQTTGYLSGLVVKGDAPWQTLEEVIAFADANPGRFTYATTGVGSSMDIAMQDIAKAKGVEFTHVPFRGSNEALQSLLGRQISAVVSSSDWARFVDDGSVRLLFTCGRQRPPRFAQAPTLLELGYDLVFTQPFGLAGPRGMAPEVVKALHDGFRAALADPDYRRVLERLGMQDEYLDSAAYAAAVRRLVAEERDVVQRFNLRQGG